MGSPTGPAAAIPHQKLLRAQRILYWFRDEVVRTAVGWGSAATTVNYSVSGRLWVGFVGCGEIGETWSVDGYGWYDCVVLGRCFEVEVKICMKRARRVTEVIDVVGRAIVLKYRDVWMRCWHVMYWNGTWKHVGDGKLNRKIYILF